VNKELRDYIRKEISRAKQAKLSFYADPMPKGSWIRCENCNELFAKNKKYQRFCSKKCASRRHHLMKDYHRKK